MNANSGSPTALVIDESASWRALAAAVLREHGWTVMASEVLPEPAPAAPYDLLVIEPANNPAVTADLDRLAAWARRFIFLTYLNAADSPQPEADGVRLLGVMQKGTFNASIAEDIGGALDRASRRRRERAPHRHRSGERAAAASRPRRRRHARRAGSLPRCRSGRPL